MDFFIKVWEPSVLSSSQRYQRKRVGVSPYEIMYVNCPYNIRTLLFYKYSKKKEERKITSKSHSLL